MHTNFKIYKVKILNHKIKFKYLKFIYKKTTVDHILKEIHYAELITYYTNYQLYLIFHKDIDVGI